MKLTRLSFLTAVFFAPAMAVVAETCAVVTTSHKYMTGAVEFIENLTRGTIDDGGGVVFRDTSGGFRVVFAEVDIAQKNSLKAGLECLSKAELKRTVNYTLSRVGEDVMDTGWPDWRAKWLRNMPANIRPEIEQCYGLYLGRSYTKKACLNAYLGLFEYIRDNPNVVDNVKGISNFASTLRHRACFHSKHQLMCLAVITKYKDGTQSWEKKLYRMAVAASS